MRRLLQSLIRTDEDLEALCLDYFPEIHSRFARGMDRLAKFNLLIELTAPTKIVTGLRDCFREDLSAQAMIDHFLAEPQRDEEREARTQWNKIEQLHLQREERVRLGQSTAEIDKELVAAKRAQRADTALSEGGILKDRYRLIECVGRGGFAKVWRAFDRIERRTVAVKILRGDLKEEPRRLERFERGARQMKGLNHANIVRVLEGPEESDGFHYFIMDYLSGGDLLHAVTTRSFAQAVCRRAILEVGRALEYAHERSLVHRDVKPQNILLDEKGTAFLTDFDLVWAADTTGGTQSGFLGTHIYVAPEQAEDAKSVDRRADVYALGMTALFVLHGGVLPQKAVYQRALFIDGLDCPEALKALLRETTALDPDERPATAEEFCRRFAAALPEAAPSVAVPTTDRPISIPSRRRTGGILGISVIGLLLLGASYLGFRKTPSASSHRSVATVDESQHIEALAAALPVPKKTESPAAPSVPAAPTKTAKIGVLKSAPAAEPIKVQFAFTDRGKIGLSCGGKPMINQDCAALSEICKVTTLVYPGELCSARNATGKKRYTYLELKRVGTDRKDIRHVLVRFD